MKKYICFVLVFLMFSLIISSHAEVFSLRKGIQFGDSIEAVIEKTKEDGVEFTDDDSTEGTHSLNSNPGIEIAGIEGTFQHYFFNEEGALYSVKFELPYDFGKVDFNSLSSVDDFKNFVQTIPNGLISGKDTYNLEPGNLYYDLISRLTDKYGNPLTVDKSAFQGKTLADAIEYYLEGDVHGTKIEYKEWLIEQSDGSAIKIECAYVGHSYSMEALAGDGIFHLRYKLLWGYELIPSDVIKNAVDNEMAIYNDL